MTNKNLELQIGARKPGDFVKAPRGKSLINSIKYSLFEKDEDINYSVPKITLYNPSHYTDFPSLRESHCVISSSLYKYTPLLLELLTHYLFPVQSHLQLLSPNTTPSTNQPPKHSTSTREMASDKEAEPVIIGNYVEMETEGKPQDMKSKLSKFLWHGGSVYDAWFSCASNQVLLYLTLLLYIHKFISSSFFCMGFLVLMVSL